ncbi:MAG: hypothetical protein B7Z73_10365 [Planctomycetia bacterium 21-64-5]|nr:MAG: hypothetical protein B7Z73_10365 [Planctomycetia bacterium 21-64-5]
MTRVIVDDSLRAKLHDLSEALVFCDEGGRIFGHFVPVMDPSQWEPVSPSISEEELDRRARSNEPRYTTAEVLARLEDLARRGTA